MTSDDIRALIEARPKPTLHERAANAAYEDALVWQEVGVPEKERVARLMLFSDAWQRMKEELDRELGEIVGS